jgi:DNA polymerase-3 subunit gamma/tau
MGQALYRTNRPKKLSDIVGQQHITKTLEQALKTGRISHAYLFTGPRGIGKTSIARILAHEINGLPYTDDSMHMDIIEIDAASNRRIDEIRDLRDKVHIAPTSARYKVYIIDEVHMLTKEAFNALLKTLEEPPAHVVFILATTEIHKLPETIISRTQRFTFKPVDSAQVAAHLRTIAAKEKIAIDDAALEFLAEAGEGSFRDSISLLDQIGASGQKVGLAEVQALLGIPPKDAIQSLLGMVVNKATPADILTSLEKLYDSGFQPVQIAHQMVRDLRTSLTGGMSIEVDASWALTLMRSLIDTGRSHDPKRYLEIALINQATSHDEKLAVHAVVHAIIPAAITSKNTSAPAKPAAEPSSPFQPLTQPSGAARHLQSADAVDKVKGAEKPAGVASAQKVKEQDKSSTTVPASSTGAASQPKYVPRSVANVHNAANDETDTTKGAVPDTIDFWPQVLDAIRKQYYTLYSVLKTAEPTLTDEGLVLACTYPFHQKRIKEAKNTHIIDGIIKDISGQNIAWTCVVKAAGQPVAAAAGNPLGGTAAVAVNADLGDIDSISNIFGGGELLES